MIFRNMTRLVITISLRCSQITCIQRRKIQGYGIVPVHETTMKENCIFEPHKPRHSSQMIQYDVRVHANLQTLTSCLAGMAVKRFPLKSNDRSVLFVSSILMKFPHPSSAMELSAKLQSARDQKTHHILSEVWCI